MATSNLMAPAEPATDHRLMDFGEVSAMLARAISVPDGKLTKFHARLRNFLRLGWPVVPTTKGKARRFTRDDYIDLAAVTELTVLGIQPEHAIQIARDNRRAIHFDPPGTLGPCGVRLSAQIGSGPVRSETLLYIGHYMEAYDAN